MGMVVHVYQNLYKHKMILIYAILLVFIHKSELKWNICHKRAGSSNNKQDPIKYVGKMR